MGDWVEFTHVPVKNNVKETDLKTFWSKEKKSGKAMFIGYRHVFDGHTRYFPSANDPEASRVFIQEKTHEVWLVVSDERKNPFYVYPPDDMEGES